MKNKAKSIKIISILVLAIVIVVAIILCIKFISNKENVSVNKLQELKQTISSYNEGQENNKIEVVIKEDTNEVVLDIKTLMVEQDGTKHNSSINYTTKEISSIIYNKDNSLQQIVTFSIDEAYNVTNVVAYFHESGDIRVYKSEDEEFDKYKKIANSVSLILKRVLNDKDSSLFNKTIEDLR